MSTVGAVHAVGPWPEHLDLEHWCSRFSQAVEPDLIRSSFRHAPHAGRRPIRERRRVWREAVA